MPYAEYLGVLIWFEVYEGKDAMAKKPFNDKYPKSIALTLRMLKPFFGSVCAAALHCTRTGAHRALTRSGRSHTLAQFGRSLG